MHPAVHPIAILLCLAPAAVLAWKWHTDQLGFNRIEYIARYTGDWTIRLLFATLTITPLRRIPGLNPIIRFRRTLGLAAFFYGCLHVFHYLWLDKLWDWNEMIEDLTIRRFFIAGAVAFLLMVPLALTSTAGAIRRLGGKRWQLLHRLIYLSAAAAVLHYHWQGKAYLLDPLFYAGALALLLGYRAAVWLHRRFAKAKTRSPIAAGSSGPIAGPRSQSHRTPPAGRPLA